MRKPKTTAEPEKELIVTSMKLPKGEKRIINSLFVLHGLNFTQGVYQSLKFVMKLHEEGRITISENGITENSKGD